MSLDYQNFIFDTLIGFFKERVNSFVNNEENNLKYSKESIDSFATIIRGKENKIVINFDIQKDNPKLQLGDEIYI